MRVVVVTGICVPDDAISAAVASQAEMLAGLPGIERVDVFAQMCTRELRCDSHTVSSSWELLCHDRFQAADVAIFHWGIHFDLFDALTIMRGRVEGALGPMPAVHFHNCTPRDLVDADHHVTIDRSIAQGQLVVGSDIAVWTFSPFNESTLLDWGVRPTQIRFVPFAVEPPRPLQDRRGGERVELLCVGRMVPAKAQHVAIDALSKLPPELRDKVRLRIAGNALFSSREYVATLTQMISDRDLSATVEIVGQPDDDGLWRLYEESHVLVAPSQHEGLCVPVLEAYHAGCRAIGSDAGNLPNVVQPPDPIFPANDSTALADAIARVAHEVLAGTRVERESVTDLLRRYSSATAHESLSDALGSLMSPSQHGIRHGGAT
jgi:glycosyltransferase involved in cell wall biosynthesis